MRPVMGVSINTRNVSFHERFIIREIMPIVLINVLSSTLTFRHTVLPIKLVSLDNLDVISPERENVKKLTSVLFCSVQFLFFSLSRCVLFCLAWSVLSIMSCLASSCALLPCVFIFNI